MTTKEMMAAIEHAIDDLGAVLQDLRDADEGEIDLEDVNMAYASSAKRSIDRVIDAVHESAS